MIKTFLEKQKPKIDAEIEKLLNRKWSKKEIERFVGKIEYEIDEKGAQNSLLIPIWDLLDRGGKRWRPALMLSIAKSFGANEEQILPFTPIPELIHNGTLMVDDIEDRSELRRGKKAIHLIYGEDVAINTGNAMYYLPLVIIKEKEGEIGEKKAKKLYEVYVEEMIKLAFGQGLDIWWHNKEHGEKISENEYLQMTAFKTGTLARMAAKFGAILGGANDGEIKKIGKFAESIGVAFQIQDDVLNIAPSKEWGKSIGDDITEGKITLIVIKALEELDEKKGKQLMQILSEHTRDKKKIETAISLIKETQAVEYAKNKTKELVKSAWRDVEKILPEGENKKTLEAFANYLIEREI